MRTFAVRRVINVCLSAYNNSNSFQYKLEFCGLYEKLLSFVPCEFTGLSNNYKNALQNVWF